MSQNLNIIKEEYVEEDIESYGKLIRRVRAYIGGNEYAFESACSDSMESLVKHVLARWKSKGLIS